MIILARDGAPQVPAGRIKTFARPSECLWMHLWITGQVAADPRRATRGKWAASPSCSAVAGAGCRRTNEVDIGAPCSKDVPVSLFAGQVRDSRK